MAEYEQGVERGEKPLSVKRKDRELFPVLFLSFSAFPFPLPVIFHIEYGLSLIHISFAMDNYGLKAAYLEEQGQHITASTTEREIERGYNPERAERYQAVADVLGTSDPEAIGSMSLKEIREQHGDALEQVFPGMTKSALRLSSILRQVQAFFEDDGSGPAYELSLIHI